MPSPVSHVISMTFCKSSHQEKPSCIYKCGNVVLFTITFPHVYIQISYQFSHIPHIEIHWLPAPVFHGNCPLYYWHSEENYSPSVPYLDSLTLKWVPWISHLNKISIFVENLIIMLSCLVGKLDDRWFGLDRCCLCAKFHGTWSVRFDSCGSIMRLTPWHVSFKFYNCGSNMTLAPWHLPFRFYSCGSMALVTQIW